MQMFSISLQPCTVTGSSGRNNLRFGLYLKSCKEILHTCNRERKKILIFYKGRIFMPKEVAYRCTAEKIIYVHSHSRNREDENALPK